MLIPRQRKQLWDLREREGRRLAKFHNKGSAKFEFRVGAKRRRMARTFSAGRPVVRWQPKLGLLDQLSQALTGQPVVRLQC